MISKNQFSDAVSGLDVETVERYLQAEQACLQKKAKRRRTRIFTALAAAVLALAMLASFAIIPFVPKTYDLNYEFPKHQFANQSVRVYYATESGELKSERVKLPDTESNVFLTWKHLNTVGDEVQLLEYVVDVEEDAGTAVVPNNLWEFLVMKLNGSASDGYKTVTATLSPQITSYENYDALIESLRHTLAKYAGVTPEQVRFLIDGEQIGTVFGGLQFYHNLQGGGDVIIGTGDTLEITVGMTNISDEDIPYEGSSSAFVPDAVLKTGAVVIEHEVYPHTEDIVQLSLAPGESREITYRFAIPNDAPAGIYDLTVSFKEHSLQFKGVLEIAETTHDAIAFAPEYFGPFLDSHGFDSAEPGDFKQALGNLTYQSTGVFDLMDQTDVEWMPGYDGQIWIGDDIEYQYSIFRTDSANAPVIKNHITVTALPDGMTLLCGECHSGTLSGALEALGYGAQSAQELIAQKSDVILESGASYYLSLIYKNGIYALSYCDVVFYDGSAVLRQMQLRYDEQTQAFLNLYISTSTSGYSIPATIKRTYQGVYVNWPLNDLQSLQLLEMVNTGSWEVDWPIYTDFTVTPIISLGGNTVMFEEDWLLGTGCYITPTEKQVQFIRKLLKSFTLYEGDVAFHFATSDETVAYVELDEQQAQAVLDMLNRGEWKQGVLELEAGTNCVVGNLSLAYDPSTGIFVHGDKYLNLSKEDTDKINAILDMYR